MGNSREIVQWAFNQDREVGEVSKVFDLDGKYVVTALVGYKEKGFPPYNQLKAELEPLAKREKKSQMFMDEFNKASSGKSDLNAISSEMGLSTIPSSFTFSSFSVPSAAVEPGLVGYSFGVPSGKIAKPFQGKAGVYLIQVDEMQTVDLPEELKEQKNSISSNVKSRVDNNVSIALSKVAKVEDKRYKFF